MKPIPSAPPPENGTLNAFVLERFLPFRLSVLANRMTRAIARFYSQRFQLTAPEWRTMAVLGCYGAMTAHSVVERTTMDKVRVSRAVAKLLATGYVTRRTDPEDRRRAILELTPAGLTIYRQLVPLVRSVEDKLLADLSPAERTALEQTIAKIERRVVGTLGNDDEAGEEEE